MIKLNNLNEASEIEMNELKPTEQKQVQAFAKIVGGKIVTIWSGIHGKIVDIEADGNFGSGYRWDANTLKKLIALKIRWVEADGDNLSIAF